MVEIRKTQTFANWLADLRDRQAKARIIVRIERMQAGNFGDHKSVGDGVSEMRIDYGPGYRVYFAVRGTTIVILLCGGDKGTQRMDVAKAKQLAKEV
ncbi:putative addiction module killer protein [Bosea sp. CRIB-10]|uniref:type II toxin-antitoxin system RelE/ParE family toxin n=1 Tax=Bosea sp. CRIB-10 TaxID=378404 RepID=UPI0008EC7AF2|nr:type II toxin-antitoxin system RelE/ParE family toxin [Bosea sp. CRIB-10]SFD34676.1 putative addiction module killer protein [Bosea sp. CRIB-10]